MFRWVLPLALVVAVCAQQIVDEFDLPTCARNNPERDQCLRSAIADSITQLKEGHQLLGIRGLDPMEVKEAKTGFDAGFMRSKLVAKNVKGYGLSSVEIRDVRSEVTDKSLNMEIDAYIPKIILEGLYKGDSKFGDYQVNSRGAFNVSMTDVTSTWIIEGEAEERDGETFMRIKHFRMSPIVGDMKVYATGLLPDEALNNVAVSFINQYWPTAYQALRPYAEASWDPIMTEISNEVFLRIPFDKLMPRA